MVYSSSPRFTTSSDILKAKWEKYTRKGFQESNVYTTNNRERIESVS